MVLMSPSGFLMKSMAKIKEIPTKAYTLAIRRAEFPGPTRLKWEKLKTFNEFMKKNEI